MMRALIEAVERLRRKFDFGAKKAEASKERRQQVKRPRKRKRRR